MDKLWGLFSYTLIAIFKYEYVHVFILFTSYLCITSVLTALQNYGADVSFMYIHFPYSGGSAV